jgi:hypothetical protein
VKPFPAIDMNEIDEMSARTGASKTRGQQAPKVRPPFKVRHEPPTLEDAIYAAQGLTGEVEQQIEFVSDLLNMPPAELRPHVLKAGSKASTSNRVFVSARSGMQRAVVIETTRRPRAKKSSELGGSLS